MRLFGKTAIAIGMTSALALGTVTASQAHVRPWVAGAAGFAVGAAVGSAAANASYYGPNYYYGGYYGPDYAYGAYAYEPAYAYQSTYAYEPAYYSYQANYGYRNRWSPYNPTYANTGDPNYGVAVGYDSYAYAPGYRAYGSAGTVPAHYDPGYGYNSNTLSPWQERRLEGTDY